MRSAESAPTLPQNRDHDPRRFKIQARLMSRAGIDALDVAASHDWVDRNAERFAQIITEDEALYEKLHSTDPDIRETALVDLEARLAEPDEDTEENI